MRVTNPDSVALSVDSHPLRQILRDIGPDSCPDVCNFHCHTQCSDGSLQPLALIERAAARGQGRARTAAETAGWVDGPDAAARSGGNGNGDMAGGNGDSAGGDGETCGGEGRVGGQTRRGGSR